MQGAGLPPTPQIPSISPVSLTLTYGPSFQHPTVQMPAVPQPPSIQAQANVQPIVPPGTVPLISSRFPQQNVQPPLAPSTPAPLSVPSPGTIRPLSPGQITETFLPVGPVNPPTILDITPITLPTARPAQALQLTEKAPPVYKPFYMFPITCRYCKRQLGNKKDEYQQKLSEGTHPGQAMTELGITRPCCRMLVATAVTLPSLPPIYEIDPNLRRLIGLPELVTTKPTEYQDIQSPLQAIREPSNVIQPVEVITGNLAYVFAPGIPTPTTGNTPTVSGPATFSSHPVQAGINTSIPRMEKHIIPSFPSPVSTIPPPVYVPSSSGPGALNGGIAPSIPLSMQPVAPISSGTRHPSSRRAPPGAIPLGTQGTGQVGLPISGLSPSVVTPYQQTTTPPSIPTPSYTPTMPPVPLPISQVQYKPAPSQYAHTSISANVGSVAANQMMLTPTLDTLLSTK